MKRIREFWNNNPCNPVGRYDIHPWLLDYFHEGKDKKMLEIGCGLGEDSSRFLAVGSDVVSLDMSSNSIKIARFKIKGKFVLADAENLPIKRIFIFSFLLSGFLILNLKLEMLAG